MQEQQNQRMVIRIGKNTLSFALPGMGDGAGSVRHVPYVVKAGVSIAANLRTAFKSEELSAKDCRQAKVLISSPYLLVPIEQFEESEKETLYEYSFPAGEEQRVMIYNVLPDQKTICLFAVNKDLFGVLNDRFSQVSLFHVMMPVWRQLHKRSYTGHRNKVFAYFHDELVDVCCFQQNRFKYCNSFEAKYAHDVLYFLLYVWNQLRLDVQHDELHLLGNDIPEKAWLMEELKRYVKNTYAMSPAACLGEGVQEKLPGMPFDMTTFITKGI